MNTRWDSGVGDRERGISAMSLRSGQAFGEEDAAACGTVLQMALVITARYSELPPELP